MKRFTLILSLLVAMVTTTMAQSGDVRLTAEELNAKTEKTAILIKCTQESSYTTYYNPTGRGELGENSIVYWVPAGDGGFYITKGDGENDYLQTNNITTFGTQATAAKFHAVKPTGSGSGVESFAGANCYENEATGGEYWVRLAFTDNSKWFNFNGFQYNTGTGVWTVQNIYEVVTITYNIKYNDETKLTVETTAIVGNDFPEIPASSLPFGVTATKPEGKVSAEGTFDVEASVSLPFDYADSYEKINKWYYIQMHSYGGTYSRFLQYAETYIEWADLTRTTSENDTYTWGFIGDPFTGFKLVNYGAPADANAVVSASDSGNPGFGAIADAVVWSVKASRTNPDSEHFCFQYPGSNNYMNAQNGKVSFWWDNDQGSTMWVTERDMTGATELQELVDKVDAVSASYQGAIGTAVGNLTEESVTAVANALATAKSILALDGRTPAQIAEAHLALQTAIDNLVTVQPTEGKFYTIASASEQNEDSRTGKMIYVNADGGMKFDVADDTNLGYLFQFEAAGEGQFYMYNVAKDRYLNTANEHGYGQEKALAEEATGAKKVTIANLGRENVVGLWPEGGAMIHAEAATGNVVAWDNEQNNNGSAWRIVEVEEPTTAAFDLTIGEAGYATLYLGCAVTVPVGVEAFPITVDGEWAVFGEALTTIPANTGVIIAGENGEAATAATYKFNYAAPVAAIGGNQLQGSTIDSYKEGPAYVLGIVNEKVGFYTATLNLDADGKTGTTHFKNNANKAYLVVPGASEVASYSFRFGEGTTGVEKVEMRNEKSEIFDLTGRRVENITAPGIYVVNGKKVLVK